MHDHRHGHDDHHATHDDDHGHAHPAPPRAAAAGHNRPKATVQWQVPHRPDGDAPPPDPERDLDLVEASFVESFGRAGDPTSFLRLANIPFVGVDEAGRRLHLLRVEMESLTDVGAVSPLLGGAGFHYDPLPAPMVSHRRRLAFVYHDGRGLARLDFAAARRLTDVSASSHFALTPEG